MLLFVQGMIGAQGEKGVLGVRGDAGTPGVKVLPIREEGLEPVS
jgi:hypothetical protein